MRFQFTLRAPWLQVMRSHMGTYPSAVPGMAADRGQAPAGDTAHLVDVLLPYGVISGLKPMTPGRARAHVL